MGVTTLVEVVLDRFLDLACLRVHKLHRVKWRGLVGNWVGLQEMMPVLCQLLYVKADQLSLPPRPLSCTTPIYLYAKSTILVSAEVALPSPLSTVTTILVLLLLLQVQVLIRNAYI